MNGEMDLAENVNGTAVEWFDPARIDEEKTLGDFERSALVMSEILDWVYSAGNAGRYRSGRGKVREIRILAALWVVRPQMFDYASERAMARSLRISKTHFSRWVTRFRCRFNVTNRLMKNDARHRSPQHQCRSASKG